VADDETAMRQIETEAWLLPSDRHGTEASFVPHHPSVNFGSICQRNGFDHWTDSLQGQESVSSASFAGPVIVPAIERMPKRSGTGLTLIGPSPPAPATMSLPRKLSGLAEWSKSTKKRSQAPSPTVEMLPPALAL